MLSRASTCWDWSGVTVTAAPALSALTGPRGRSMLFPRATVDGDDLGVSWLPPAANTATAPAIRSTTTTAIPMTRTRRRVCCRSSVRDGTSSMAAPGYETERRPGRSPEDLGGPGGRRVGDRSYDRGLHAARCSGSRERE